MSPPMPSTIIFIVHRPFAAAPHVPQRRQPDAGPPRRPGRGAARAGAPAHGLRNPGLAKPEPARRRVIRDLKNALIRIENKTYGVCRVTGKLIDKERLKAVPHATLSIEAKKMQ